MPRKPTGRSELLTIRVTSEELAEITRRGGGKGKASEWARRLLLGPVGLAAAVPEPVEEAGEPLVEEVRADEPPTKRKPKAPKP